MSNTWYSIQAKADDAEVRIYNEIGGWGISAEAFANDIAKVKAKTIHLRINSPGGAAFEAFAIYNTLRNHPARIVAHVDGLAASAASVVMLAGDEVRIAENGFVMIHNAHGGVYGGADDMRRNADVLEKLNATLAKLYAKKMGGSEEDVKDLMDAETWYTADEAKAVGLVDAVEEEADNLPEAAAKAVEKYAKAPEQVRRFAAMYIQTNGTQPLATVAGADAATPSPEKSMTIDAFNAFAAEHPDATAKYVKQGKDAARSEEIARAKAIKEVCPDAALALDAFIGGQTSDEVKTTADAVAKARAADAAALAAKDAEIQRLTALIGTQGAIGTNGEAQDASNRANKPDPSDVKASAEFAWDREMTDEQKSAWLDRDTFIAARVRTANK